MYHSFFIHSSTDGHRGCFQIWSNLYVKYNEQNKLVSKIETHAYMEQTGS